MLDVVVSLVGPVRFGLVWSADFKGGRSHRVQSPRGGIIKCDFGRQFDLMFNPGYDWINTRDST